MESLWLSADPAEMNILGPTPFPRLNEASGIVLLFAVLFLALSLVSHHPTDPSWNSATGVAEVQNLTGRAGAHLADLLIQTIGFGAFLIPALLLALAWNWLRSRAMAAQGARLAGAALLVAASCAMLGLAEGDPGAQGAPAGGVFGWLVASALVSLFNLTGAVLLVSTMLLLSMYLLTSFSMSGAHGWMRNWVGDGGSLRERLSEWLTTHLRRRQTQTPRRPPESDSRSREEIEVEIAKPTFRRRTERATEGAGGEIPIRTLDDMMAPAAPMAAAARAAVGAETADAPPFEPDAAPAQTRIETRGAEPALVEYRLPEPDATEPARPAPPTRRSFTYAIPPTDLLNEPEGKPPYDAQELKEIAGKIKSKFEEFNVLGSVTQINPGPVVTTFEFKPEAGIKYSRITTLTEDLCLGLQAESILIERIPGKPTVGIEVPNSRREVISLRQMLESDEFRASSSRMTISLGKDISGRIRVAALETMPHLLIAGSTGSGKSVMLNSLIMSVLYKSTPDDVRMILIDPKRVEMGMYEGIPHLLTPVITDARKATNALRNAVLEMERRLKLLASQGVRNIDQFNRKMRQLMNQPRSLFEEDDAASDEELRPLPCILIVIDELADLMMIERGNVEESITRLAQMARAVGMHLVVATQRPSVDVITGLIKANFPARVSFRVATRVDSRTILDVMGAEHLLGKGDMLFLPPGSSRLTRVHAPYVSETETNQVVEFWKKQARPDYDQSYLLAPPEDEEDDARSSDDTEAFNDPAYQDAVRVVLEVGKASTSTLQRRLRLGYGRAARILDVMYKEGIIGPPDGSRPREVLKRPDWLAEVDHQLR